MERMSALDAGFWDLENEHTSLHIAAVAVFEGPVPDQEQLRARYAGRIQRIPRYRQRMRRVPFGLARPVWAPDPRFDLDYHLRRTAVPAPGSEDELVRLVGRLMSQRLDPDRPLWETWVIEGVAGGRWALLTKMHHSMIDGIGGMDLFAAMLDAPASGHLPARRPERESVPSDFRLVAEALIERVRDAGRTGAGFVAGARHPVRFARLLATGVRGAGDYLRAVRPFAATSLAGPLGKPRRYRTVTVDLAEVHTVRHALGGSVNDVALTVVAHGLRELLRSRGETAAEHSVRCLVPVSVRRPGERGELTNRVSALLLDLPVEFADITATHGAVVNRMAALKHSAEAPAGDLVVGVAGAVPPMAVSAALHAVLRVPHRIITTVITNVPGPREPVYLLGHRMIAIYPYVPIADILRIGIALTSYDGQLIFGITCDRDSVPDIDVLTASMAAALAELVKAATAQEGER